MDDFGQIDLIVYPQFQDSGQWLPIFGISGSLWATSSYNALVLLATLATKNATIIVPVYLW